MIRSIAGFFLSICLASTASAGTWAENLFSELSHEFGSIPRGSDQRCQFIINNSTQGPIRLTGMSRTCGCTQVTLDEKVVLDQNTKVSRENKLILPGQQARIGVVLDTRGFTGHKSAEITVSFDQPSNVDVRLTVSSFIRQDIVLNPGAIQFGSLSSGQEMIKELDIEYAGAANWQILSVTSASPDMDVQFAELYRRPGQVGYRITANLKATAPVGSLRESITVETNDSGVPQFGLLVNGQIQPELIVTPTSLSMGSLRTGQTVTRQVLLRGKKPFQVVSVEGGNGEFRVEKPEGSSAFHKVIVRFTGSDETGNHECNFKVVTDLAEQSATEFKASVQITR